MDTTTYLWESKLVMSPRPTASPSTSALSTTHTMTSTPRLYRSHIGRNRG